MNFDKDVVDKMINLLPPILGETPFGMLMDDHGPKNPIYFDEIQEQILDIDGDADIKYGMSKMVIIAPSLKNIVIKIPFCGIYDMYYDDYDRKYKNILYQDDDLCEYNFTFFDNARTKDRTDYCAVEYEKYQKLKTLNLNNFVAETEFYTFLSNGMKVYLQEKGFSSEDDPNWQGRKSSQKSHNLAKHWSEDEGITINTEWVGLCIDQYGEEKTKEFLDYCYYKDPIIISDCHDGNVGYRMNGTPFLLDYSGFED